MFRRISRASRLGETNIVGEMHSIDKMTNIGVDSGLDENGRDAETCSVCGIVQTDGSNKLVKSVCSIGLSTAPHSLTLQVTGKAAAWYDLFSSTVNQRTAQSI